MLRNREPGKRARGTPGSLPLPSSPATGCLGRNLSAKINLLARVVMYTCREDDTRGEWSAASGQA